MNYVRGNIWMRNKFIPSKHIIHMRKLVPKSTGETAILAAVSLLLASLLLLNTPGPVKDTILIASTGNTVFSVDTADVPYEFERKIPSVLKGLGLPEGVSLAQWYRVENGLFNQHYAHIASFMIAKHIGSQVRDLRGRSREVCSSDTDGSLGG